MRRLVELHKKTLSSFLEQRRDLLLVVRASDAEIMAWARSHSAIVLTHDLDFTTILALTRADGPSVVQLRAQNILPEALAESVLQALASHAAALTAGAIVSIDHMQARVRILPLT